MNKVWTDGEKEFIRQNAQTMKDKDIAKSLTRTSGRSVTLDAVRKQRQKLGITKSPGRGICDVKQKKTSSVGVGVPSPLRAALDSGSTFALDAVEIGDRPNVQSGI